MIAAADFVSMLFLARELTHREHLKTTSYAKHVALGDFYESVVEMADEFAEVYQGQYGIIKDIPLGENEFSGEIDDILESQLEWIEKLREKNFTKPIDRPLQNLIDTICALYLRTIYKLRNLK